MSSMLASFVTTIVILVALLIGLRLTGARAPRVAALFSLVAGTLAVVSVAVPMLDGGVTLDAVDRMGKALPWLPMAAMTLGLVGLATGVFALVRNEHSWRTLIGSTAGALVTLFWLLLAFGEVLWPH
ncbi:MAG TPA: hypothetical protein VLS51_05380 [Propionibacteriaceae bacterium]|nr:hypothetical protein [Propionibacteriaceae bacterium]